MFLGSSPLMLIDMWIARAAGEPRLYAGGVTDPASGTWEATFEHIDWQLLANLTFFLGTMCEHLLDVRVRARACVCARYCLKLAVRGCCYLLTTRRRSVRNLGRHLVEFGVVLPWSRRIQHAHRCACHASVGRLGHQCPVRLVLGAALASRALGSRADDTQSVARECQPHRAVRLVRSRRLVLPAWRLAVCLRRLLVHLVGQRDRMLDRRARRGRVLLRRRTAVLSAASYHVQATGALHSHRRTQERPHSNDPDRDRATNAASLVSTPMAHCESRSTTTCNE